MRQRVARQNTRELAGRQRSLGRVHRQPAGRLDAANRAVTPASAAANAASPRYRPLM